MKHTVIAGLIAAMLSGCATILGGGAEQTVTFNTVPEEASISIINRGGQKVHAGVTPITLTLKRSAGYFRPEQYRVRFEKPGFQTKEVVVSGSLNGWYLGNILFGGLIGMLIVDPLTGAMYKLSPEALETLLDADGTKASSKEGRLTVMLAENVPAALWKHAQPVGAH